MFLTALLVAALSGCDGFDNPLRWEESPIADDLIGTWKAVEGPDTGVRARVSRKDNEMLGFELTYPENTKGPFKSASTSNARRSSARSLAPEPCTSSR